MVVGVDGQHQVATGRGKKGVLGERQHRRDVTHGGRGHPLAQDLDQARVRIGGEDVVDGRSEPKREVPRARADLADHRLARQGEHAQHLGRLLPGVAVGLFHLADVRVQIWRVSEGVGGVIVGHYGPS